VRELMDGWWWAQRRGPMLDLNPGEPDARLGARSGRGGTANIARQG